MLVNLTNEFLADNKPRAEAACKFHETPDGLLELSNRRLGIFGNPKSLVETWGCLPGHDKILCSDFFVAEKLKELGFQVTVIL